MQLRFRLLLLAALVIVVVTGSVAAREETKPVDKSESTNLEADGEKSKKQRDDIQLDSGKARVKQKWQRYKPPSSKKAKKAALRKEKALTKTGKEKWKAAAEEARGKKSKRSVQYVERASESRQKLTRKDKLWKEGKEKDLKVEKRQLSGEGKRSNVDKIKQGAKVTGKRTRQKDNWKSDEDSSVCAKDELCSSGSDNSIGSEKKKWERKNSGEKSRGEKLIKLNKAGDEDLTDGTESVSANGRMETKSDDIGEGEQRTSEGSKQAAKPKGPKSPEAAPAVQPESPEMFASKVKAAKVRREEDAGGELEEAGADIEEGAGEDIEEGARKNSSGNHKVKRSYIVEEEYDPECKGCLDRSLMDDTGGMESSNWNTVRSLSGQSRVRRYIVEEEIIEENADGEQGANDGDGKSRFMQ